MPARKNKITLFDTNTHISSSRWSMQYSFSRFPPIPLDTFITKFFLLFSLFTFLHIFHSISFILRHQIISSVFVSQWWTEKRWLLDSQEPADSNTNFEVYSIQIRSVLYRESGIYSCVYLYMGPLSYCTDQCD